MVTEAKFWSKVTLGEGGCLEWIGAKNEHGYGHLVLLGKLHKAHRLAYELLVGKIPNNLQIDHLCRNRGCVAPDHLEAVTASENNRRGLNPKLAALRQLNKTHCKRGHAYDANNTYVAPRGNRTCRTCAKLKNKG